jgi:hypothetical protein
MKAKATRKNIRSAADSFLARGIEPTCEQIREALGNVGSKTTIVSHMQEWRAENGIGKPACLQRIERKLDMLLERLFD